jgi:hypothetical protein
LNIWASSKKLYLCSQSTSEIGLYLQEPRQFSRLEAWSHTDQTD